MEVLIPILILVGVAALIVSIIFAAKHFEKKRREALESAAEEMGLAFLPEGDQTIHSQVASFGLFNLGRARKMTNLISGSTDEVQIALFDYKYVTGSGKHQATHTQTVASLQSNQLRVPVFTMRAESMFDKIGSALGYQDIDFESHPEFSRMFVLKGENEPQIREFFSPEVLEFFETQNGTSVEARPGAIILYRPGKRVKPDQIKDLLSQAYGVFGVMVDKKET